MNWKVKQKSLVCDSHFEYVFKNIKTTIKNNRCFFCVLFWRLKEHKNNHTIAKGPVYLIELSNNREALNNKRLQSYRRCVIMKKIKSIILEWIEIIAIAFIIALVVETFFFSFAVVQGQSMEPTISNKDRLLVVKYPFFRNSIKEGDIVVFNPPGTTDEIFIKRVVAKGTDSFTISDGCLFINNEEVAEDYIYEDEYLERSYQFINGVIPKDAVFVLGDNRNDSNDSRSFGYIHKNQIIGKAAIKIWPIREVRVFLNP
ncbi:signal peptidase I [Alkaliphilus peptidifermentans DSM 18978]|uniref:Signal peptidase I n=2 Tax=Alkaliphilus TaxID=114627 RepID=A0A1G5K505_9FIRM|nr:signal peptidase I [Alkaliphilus peptidifermentans DSM 18978]